MIMFAQTSLFSDTFALSFTHRLHDQLRMTGLE